MNKTMNAGQWAMVLAVGVLFGSSFLFINVAVAELPPLTVAAARALLAAPLIWLILRLGGVRLPRPGRGWVPLLIIGTLTGAIPFATVALGQRHIDSGLGGILFGAIPVFTILISHVLLADERLSADKVLGALVGLGGVVLVIGPEALQGLGDQVLGQAITLVAALSYTLGGIYGRMRTDVPPPLQAAGQTIGGALILVPIALVVDAPWTLTPAPLTLGALVALGIVSTALPSLLFFRLIGTVGATNTSLATFFMPVTAVALGALVLAERLPPLAFGGLALILLGAAIVNGRLRLLARRPA
jgi:drug/metabolite transporter (DMT)-like permease